MSPSIKTVADLLDRLGGVPPDRVCFRPFPGTATVQDVVEVQRREGKLCELVEGVLDAGADLVHAQPHQRGDVLVALLALGQQAQHRSLVVTQPHRRKPMRRGPRDVSRGPRVAKA